MTLLRLTLCSPSHLDTHGVRTMPWHWLCQTCTKIVDSDLSNPSLFLQTPWNTNGIKFSGLFRPLFHCAFKWYSSYSSDAIASIQASCISILTCSLNGVRNLEMFKSRSTFLQLVPLCYHPFFWRWNKLGKWELVFLKYTRYSQGLRKWKQSLRSRTTFVARSALGMSKITSSFWDIQFGMWNPALSHGSVYNWSQLVTGYNWSSM